VRADVCGREAELGSADDSDRNASCKEHGGTTARKDRLKCGVIVDNCLARQLVRKQRRTVGKGYRFALGSEVAQVVVGAIWLRSWSLEEEATVPHCVKIGVG
jgi:hypothetical protein